MRDIVNHSLEPVMVSQGTTAAPDNILKMIRCSCKNSSNAKCSCVSAMLACNIFCSCEGGLECSNERNTQVDGDLESENEED